VAASKAKHLHRVEPGSRVDLAAIDPRDASAAPGDKHETIAATEELAERIADLQERLFAEAERKVLVVLQGLDTSGKGGTIEHVFDRAHPAGLRVVSFKAPSSTELARDFLWRVHAQVPAKGEIGVWDRSHYEDVLVVRVEGLAPPAVWERRYGHIDDFERMLVDEGTTIVKVFLHISRDEQRERLQARADEPDKRWKLDPHDLETREHWDEYQAAFTEMLERTSTDHAPWHLVPADRKWYRSWAVATILVEALEELDLRWPEPEGVAGTVVE
jgi:PPK2 family polyphosphate:nucleotide phosphotransferase